MNDAQTARLNLLARLITIHHHHLLGVAEVASTVSNMSFYRKYIEDPTPIVYVPFHEWAPVWLKYDDYHHFTFIQFGEYHSKMAVDSTIRNLTKIYENHISSSRLSQFSNVPEYTCPQLRHPLHLMRRFPFDKYPDALIYYATMDGQMHRCRSMDGVSLDTISYMAIRLPFTSANMRRCFVVHTLRPGANLYRDNKTNAYVDKWAPQYFQLYPEYDFHDQLSLKPKDRKLYCHQYTSTGPLRLLDFNQTPLFDIESANVSNYNYTKKYPSNTKVVEPIFKCRRTYGCTDIRFGRWKGSMIPNYNRRLFINLLMYGSSTHFKKTSSLHPFFYMLNRYLHIDGIISNMEWVVYQDGRIRQLGTEIFIGNKSKLRSIRKMEIYNKACSSYSTKP
jgi:hypothetical protein